MPGTLTTVSKAPVPEPFIYLASQSPRRSQLLQQLGVRHQLLLPGPDEDAEALESLIANEPPTAYVRRVTQLKLDAALARLRRRGLAQAPVLCADTTVARGRLIFGKPSNAADAVRMLEQLSGRTHRVLTSVAVGTRRRRLQTVQASSVTFAALSAAQIEAYVASGEPMGKAGAYAVQGRGAAYITRLRGSYSGIMGLPLFETAELLRCFEFSL